MSKKRVSVFKVLTCGVRGIRQSVEFEHRHPFNTASSDTILFAVLISYIDLFNVVDYNVACTCEFAISEKGGVHQVRDHVHSTGCIT